MVQPTIQQTRSIKHWQTISQLARHMLPTHEQTTQNTKQKYSKN